MFYTCLLHLQLKKVDPLNYNTRNTISFSVSKIPFIYIMTPTDYTDDQNTMRRVI